MSGFIAASGSEPLRPVPDRLDFRRRTWFALCCVACFTGQVVVLASRRVTAIVLAADLRYLPYIPCNLAQLARFARRADGVTLVVPPTVTHDNLAPVFGAAEALRVGLEVVSLEHLETLHSRGVIADSNHVSYFTYSKLLFAEILPHLDEILYLDVDTLIRGPIDDLLSWELHNSVGAVHELSDVGRGLFGTVRQAYFNAGVIRMSLKRLRQERLWDRALEILTDRPELRRQEQDVFNLLFSGRFDSLPPTFNVLDPAEPFGSRLAVLKDPTIFHFAGQNKPWNRDTKSSTFVREWRLQNLEVAPFGEALKALPIEPHKPISKAANDGPPKQRGLYGVAKAALPPKVKRLVKEATFQSLERAIYELEETRLALKRRGELPGLAAVHDQFPVISHPRAEGSRLDLLISVARSGTNALANAVKRSRPDVTYRSEIYAGFTDELPEEEVSTIPWFAAGHPDIRGKMPAEQRNAMRLAFKATMSEHVVDFTETLLEITPGRCLIKVFPDHLDPAAFAELLSVFRPRLLILRRNMLFSYVSLLRATRTGLFWDSDSTDVPYHVKEQDVFHYTRKCDGWFDLTAILAERLQLDCRWLTYEGIFTTGTDVAVLESFYPGLAMPTDPRTRGLKSEFQTQDRRSDSSVLGMVQAVSRLSAAAQAQLLRLPGTHAKCPERTPK